MGGQLLSTGAGPLGVIDSILDNRKDWQEKRGKDVSISTWCSCMQVRFDFSFCGSYPIFYNLLLTSPMSYIE